MRYKHNGFTLIEVLVATVISVSMLTLVMASFWSLWQTYRTADLMREMQHEVTFAMTRIADKVRSQALDYPAYTNPNACQSNVNHRLCLAGDYFFVYRDENLFMGNLDQQSPLFSEQKFAITKLHFTRFPEKSTESLQPQVGVALEIVSRRDYWGRPVEPDKALKLNLQTTISSRDYAF